MMICVVSAHTAGIQVRFWVPNSFQQQSEAAQISMDFWRLCKQDIGVLKFA